ncbi:MAG: hypothetical protein ACI4DU_08675 [Lachnospiraceae bacterium]
MKPWVIILIVVGVIVVLLAVLYFLGKKLEKKQNEQKAMLDANKQNVSMLVIDKKRIKPKDASLPASIMDQIPKAARNIKIPMVKVKIGPQILTMFCDESIFDLVPVKKEVKAEISGIYIMNVKGVHGTVIKKEEKKKSKFRQLVEKAQEKAGAKSVK